MDDMEPFKRGYLLTPPQGKILKRTWQKKYYALYQASNLGIQRVEIFDSDDQYLHHSASKLIPLSDCVKVVQAPQKNQPNVFEVICKNQLYQFSAETTQELAEWIGAFQTVAFGQQRRDSHPTLAPAPCRNSAPIVNEIQQEENMLYSTMVGPEIYTVLVKETDASRRCKLRGSYQLVVTPIHIGLSVGGTCHTTGRMIFTWPYKFIRRFQRDRETFTFEAGRKSESGEGFFIFTTTQGNAIFHAVSEYLKTYTKKEANAYPGKQTMSESRTSQERYEGNVQKDLKKVLPTPPPTASLPPIPLLPNESLYENTMPGQSKIRPPIAKPPRKNKLPSVSSQGNENNEAQPSQPSSEVTGKIDKSNTNLSPKLQSQEVDVNKYNEHPDKDTEKRSELKPSVPLQNSELVYDEPEQRVDAWKTFGLDKEVIHTENAPPTDEPGAMYASVDVTTLSPSATSTSPSPSPSFRARNKSVPESSLSKPVVPSRQFSVLTPRPNNSGDNYDRLFQFNVPINRANPHPDHIYKKLAPTHMSESDTTSLEEYSFVQDGYKVPLSSDDGAYVDPIDCIPSPEAKSILKSDIVPHFVENDEMYSIVLKPNKVTSL